MTEANEQMLPVARKSNVCFSVLEFLERQREAIETPYLEHY